MLQFFVLVHRGDIRLIPIFFR